MSDFEPSILGRAGRPQATLDGWLIGEVILLAARRAAQHSASTTESKLDRPIWRCPLCDLPPTTHREMCVHYWQDHKGIQMGDP